MTLLTKQVADARRLASLRTTGRRFGLDDKLGAVELAAATGFSLATVYRAVTAGKRTPRAVTAWAAQAGITRQHRRPSPPKPAARGKARKPSAQERRMERVARAVLEQHCAGTPAAPTSHGPGLPPDAKRDLDRRMGLLAHAEVAAFDTNRQKLTLGASVSTSSSPSSPAPSSAEPPPPSKLPPAEAAALRARMGIREDGTIEHVGDPVDARITSTPHRLTLRQQ